MIKGFNHLTLSVSDLDKSLSFYSDIFGMKLRFKSSRTIYLEGGELWLALYLDPNVRQGPLKEYTHFAFDVTSDSLKFIEFQVEKYNIELFQGNTSQGNSLYLLDPDGHKVEVHIGNIEERIASYRANPKEDYEFFDQFTIRKARVEEAIFLSNLALRSKAHWGYSEEFIEACRPHIYVDKDYIEKWPVVVGVLNEKIIGFFSLKSIGEENRLDNLWIEPKFIKYGYGKILFNEAVKYARELEWNYFRLAGEPDAVLFYEKMGAALIGEIQSRLREDLFLPHMEIKI